MAGSANAGLYLSGTWSQAGTGANQTVATAVDTRPLRVGTIVVCAGSAADTVKLFDATIQKLSVYVPINGTIVIPWNGSCLTSIVVKAASTTTVSLNWN